MEEQERKPTLKPLTTYPLPPHPRKAWRDRIFHSLPRYTGPYNVGYLEIELPARKPRPFSQIKREGQHALQLDTVLFSLYYPTNDAPDHSRRVPWLPRPRVPTCHGYAKFFSIPNFPVTAYMAATCMLTKLPAYRNARLARGAPGEIAKDETASPRFPVVVFSHGLGGSRTMYSTICGDLASYGFVVVAMEHRDGSGARSYVNVPADRDSPELNTQQRRENCNMANNSRSKDVKKTGQEDDCAAAVAARTYMVDYIFPKDNAQDTAPHNAKGVDTELRGAQIAMRLAEIEEALHILSVHINTGDKDRFIARSNLRRKPNRGSSSRGLDGIDWARDWAGRLRLGDGDVTMMGHSFGGATTVQCLRLTERFAVIGQGVLLDAWGPATPPPEGRNRITKPLLSIGSEAFMHWKANHERISEICEETAVSKALCWMLTVRGSTHLSQTDFAVLYPRYMSFFIKTLVNPLRGVYLTIAPVLEFLTIVLPFEAQGEEEDGWWVNEGLLQQGPTDPLTDDEKTSLEHRPSERWIAAKLKVRHEARRRAQRWWRIMSWRGNDVPEEVPRDHKGRPLFGLGSWGRGEEVWVHMCPEKGDIDKKLEKANTEGQRQPDGDGVDIAASG